MVQLNPIRVFDAEKDNNNNKNSGFLLARKPEEFTGIL